MAREKTDGTDGSKRSFHLTMTKTILQMIISSIKRGRARTRRRGCFRPLKSNCHLQGEIERGRKSGKKIPALKTCTPTHVFFAFIFLPSCV